MTTITTKNTREAAEYIGIQARELLNGLQADFLVERTNNRHYKANPALVRAGMATPGDLKWTQKGLAFLKKAYQPVKD